MNIFVLDRNAARSAKYLDNKRINKMAVETAQIMSTVIRGFTSHYPIINYTKLYNSTHLHHPCVLWAKENWYHWDYLYLYLRELIREIELRFGTTPKVEELMREFTKFRERSHGEPFWKTTTESPPPKCMPDEYKTDNLIESYRKYYSSKDNIYYDLEDIPNWFADLREKNTKVRLRRGEKYYEFNPDVLRGLTSNRRSL